MDYGYPFKSFLPDNISHWINFPTILQLIGATAHYATADLDEGPIVEQDITRISHRDEVNDLIRKGRLLEKSVLVTAVKAHVEDRIIVYHNKCVVFDG